MCGGPEVMVVIVLNERGPLWGRLGIMVVIVLNEQGPLRLLGGLTAVWLMVLNGGNGNEL